MPRAVFKLLWDTIQSGNECFAYVKNLAKDGSFYWVLANVTPSYDLSGQVIGYLSVRRRPNEESVKRVAELYRRMLDAERAAGARDAIAAARKLLDEALAAAGKPYEQFILEI